ncbi:MULTISPECIES: CaiB/BaiF CoA transferase family protein [Paenibacillus]|uniref:CaiB/BaiF CoA transferase family protein n=1 Tax=Paenibacillus TaxID=44249 RepID=UPI0001AFD96F|nr:MULTISPECIES: CaiB/BaiF CoA-transferase family protein [unclassified Paenibacillus]EES72590.1 CoA-transferase family III protein [Paenibacillus sp. oral taxon 786 str. D14]OXL87507.1 acyl-CoA transferase [Paenibacillus sp. SSG-1]
MLPLEGLFVVEFSTQIAGPFAGLRLADLGARVVRIEQIEDEQLPLSSLYRNKERLLFNLTRDQDVEKLHKLIAEADVLIEGFPVDSPQAAMLPYEKTQVLNPSLIHANITGYGREGAWRKKPYSDLFVQALTGIPWLNGNADDPPIPFPLSTVEMFASANLVQGILAALVQRSKAGVGMLVEVSLLESAIDYQFEVLTTHLNDGGKLPQRSLSHNAHAYLPAPYGIYETASGYLALAMGSVLELGKLLQCRALASYTDPASWFLKRDEIKQLIADHLRSKPAAVWVNDLEEGGYWCAEVQTVDDLLRHEGFVALRNVQSVQVEEQGLFLTTCCPIRIDGKHMRSRRGIVRAGEDNFRIEEEFQLL